MIDKYKQAFQEEAQELLQDLEAALLELNQRRDPELIGRAFRALHTIKGSGAMFGFDEISGFTHDIENAFDEVRSGRLSPSAELVTISLAAVDQIRAMLDEAAGRGSSDPASRQQILAKLAQLTGKPDSGASKTVAVTSGPLPLSGPMRSWHLRFAPKPDLLRNGANPLLLFRELRQLGTLEITADTSAIPSLSELDPARCYTSWDMKLTTQVSREDICDVFIFVDDQCELAIEPDSAPAGDHPVETAPKLVPASQSSASAPQKERTSSDGERPTGAATPPRQDAPGLHKEAQASSIRVSAAKLDQLVDLVGQLVTVQARLGEIAARSDDRDMQAVSEEIESLTAELRENSMSMRTLPLRATFERFKRLVYDLGRSLHKQVELTFEGGDTELDKTVIDQLNDPLMHLIRNSMDHGIEPPKARLAAGKAAAGAIHLSARHAGAQVLVSVADDGKGIDREAVRTRALEKGLVSSDAKLSDSEVFSLIMAPGFSTAREVTDVSGRGVGMDVVKRNVEALRGSIEIASRPGEGSTVTLRLPLTLAIIDGLLVRVAQSYFVLPLATTLECIELTRQDVERENGRPVVIVRGEIIPYIRLREHFHMRSERPECEQVMITETEDGRFGFAVDQVLGDHQTVIKNLGRFYRHVDLVSGATILGDGTVALILDPQRLIRDAAKNTSAKARLRAPGAARPRVSAAASGGAA